MKRITLMMLVLTFVGTSALAQESDVTKETTTTTTVSGDADLLRELWFVDDARTVPTGQVDLRLGFRWITASAPANLGDSSDDFIVTPSLAWGVYENIELFADVPAWVGDSGDKGPYEEGNGDANVGFTWRFMEPVDIWPAGAFRTTIRVPTGDNSNGVDAEGRLIFTNEYDSGIRSHINLFGTTVNGDNWESLKIGDTDLTLGGLEEIIPEEILGLFGGEESGVPEPRNFQWGVVLGLDGPLCGDGAVRWVVDYLHRSSIHYGRSNMHLLEAGWEWTISDAQKLGMSVQAGLDHTGDTPNFGASIVYAHSLTY